MSLRKVQRGQPLVIPANTYNAFIDAAEDLRRRSLDRTGAGAPRIPDSGKILIKNASGVSVGRFDVLGIDAPVITPTQNLAEFTNNPVLRGVTPTESAHTGRFVIMAEPAKSGALARAWISGVCPVRLSVHQSDHKFADVLDNQRSLLKTADSGMAQILWRDSSTFPWALVRLGGGGGGGSGDTPATFPISLSVVGGFIGSSILPASWTYHVQHAVTGEYYDTNIDPTATPHKWRRPPAGRMFAADFGYAHLDGDGALVIGWINEYPDQEVCSS